MLKFIKKIIKERDRDIKDLDDTDFHDGLKQSQIKLLESVSGTQNVVDSLMVELRDDLITERKKIEFVAEMIHDGLITTTEIGDILTFNKAAEDIFQWSQDEIKKLNLADLIPGGPQMNHRELMQKYAKSESNTLAAPRMLRGKQKDGKVTELEVSVNRLKLSKDKVNFIIIIRDERRKHHKGN